MAFDDPVAIKAVEFAKPQIFQPVAWCQAEQRRAKMADVIAMCGNPIGAFKTATDQNVIAPVQPTKRGRQRTNKPVQIGACTCQIIPRMHDMKHGIIRK